MNYDEAKNWLFSQLPMFQNIGKSGFKPGLERITEICQTLDYPQNKIQTIHVGGTNGKGSVSHIIASVFQAHGYKTGIYSSPHLVDFRERIKVNGQLIPEEFVTEFVKKIKTTTLKDSPTFFEIGAAMAFHYFAKEEVNIAIIEVGMGGRLDATNIINPIATVVTNISLDHTEYLGDTRAKIAAEKAGIAKPQTPMILGEFDHEILPVFQEKCKKINAPLYLATQEYPSDWVCDLKGKYQFKNLKTVFNLLAHLPFKFDALTTKKAVANASSSTNLLGRWQIFQKKPLIILDTAHNVAGIKEVMEQLNQEHFQKLFIIIGVVADKDLDNMIPLLPKKATYLSCQPPVPRAMPSHILHIQLQAHGLHSVHFTSIAQAYRAALMLAHENDCVFIGGSTFTVGGFLAAAQEKRL